jgi:nitroreductase/NAD-dependent dihydropyrimidine dehydrogenase PreA subunit
LSKLTAKVAIEFKEYSHMRTSFAITFTMPCPNPIVKKKNSFFMGKIAKAVSARRLVNLRLSQHFRVGDNENCNGCGHCISLCERRAIVHSELDMANFPPASENANFETEQFVQFIRNRRSHRHFKKKPIPRADLETLIDAARYAPTGGNAQAVEIIVVENKDTIRRLSDYTVDFFVSAGDKARELIARLTTQEKEAPESLIRSRLYGKRLKEARDAGLDPIFHGAPTILIFHAPREKVSTKDDCVIASTTLSLLARTMGIESTYIGLLVIAAGDNRSIRSELKLPSGNDLLSALIMGYHRLKYRYAVDRKPIQTRWIP